MIDMSVPNDGYMDGMPPMAMAMLPGANPCGGTPGSCESPAAAVLGRGVRQLEERGLERCLYSQQYSKSLRQRKREKKNDPVGSKLPPWRVFRATANSNFKTSKAPMPPHRTAPHRVASYNIASHRIAPPVRSRRRSSRTNKHASEYSALPQRGSRTVLRAHDGGQTYIAYSWYARSAEPPPPHSSVVSNHWPRWNKN